MELAVGRNDRPLSLSLSLSLCVRVFVCHLISSWCECLVAGGIGALLGLAVHRRVGGNRTAAVIRLALGGSAFCLVYPGPKHLFSSSLAVPRLPSSHSFDLMDEAELRSRALVDRQYNSLATGLLAGGFGGIAMSLPICTRLTAKLCVSHLVLRQPRFRL